MSRRMARYVIDEVQVAGGDQSVNVTFQLGCIITVKDGQEVGVGEVLSNRPVVRKAE